jgi:hypothetical protein
MKTCTYKPLPRPSYRPCTNGVRHSLDSAPATWECSWSNDHGANLTEDLCEGCASELRRREIDTWLSQIGAHVIQVKDLGAAMEAREVGGLAVQGVTDTRKRPPASDAMFGLSTIVAIRKARLALGEG